MDNIRKHHIRLRSKYAPRETSAQTIASVRTLVRAVLSMDSSVLEKHRKHMLKEALWFLTEVNGKYTTRYRSKKVVDLAINSPDSDVKIQHEHVFPRALTAQHLLDNRVEYLQSPDSLDRKLDEMVGCVVTADEHRILGKSGSGWHRYDKVKVYDMSGDTPVPFNF